MIMTYSHETVHLVLQLIKYASGKRAGGLFLRIPWPAVLNHIALRTGDYGYKQINHV